MVGGNFTPCWFSLNNSETEKAISLAFAACSNILFETFAPNLVFLTHPQSPDIGQNSDKGIFNFRISGQSLKKENCHNSRTCDNTDMKLGTATKLYKRNKTTLKKFEDNLMSANCNVTVIFLIYGQFGAIRKPDSLRIVCKTYISINSKLFHTKTKNRTKKSLTQLSHYCFE